MWTELIPAQSTSSTSFAHALAEWGVRTLGMETAAVQPVTAMRIAFVRAARRGSTAQLPLLPRAQLRRHRDDLHHAQNFAGPEHFFHSRYGVTMGPSLSWYRKNYYLYYMAGASAVYLEQGHDQFFKPGAGRAPFSTEPLGRITDEFVRFAESTRSAARPTRPSPSCFDPAHGWDMTDYPQLPLGVSPINRSDRALRELFLAAYYPAAVDEGEPATADRQAFTSATFGDIFDVLVASEQKAEALDAYRALVVGGRVEWTPAWGSASRLTREKGGTVVLNAAQVKGLPADLTGVRALGSTAEADDAVCLAKGEPRTDLAGQVYRYERVEPRGAEVLMKTPRRPARHRQPRRPRTRRLRRRARPARIGRATRARGRARARAPARGRDARPRARRGRVSRQPQRARLGRHAHKQPRRLQAATGARAGQPRGVEDVDILFRRGEIEERERVDDKRASEDGRRGPS
jgi:hypothetical protein